ncbi:methyltransferase [Marinomonas pollencensis]|uniref:Methyltransferase family protein n=1 Tax=Marinomonas pollencensis TaxID=491954 RepID=A0A3E0D9M2_9GAMM|nr:methyltransferase [Marinomonas pollencensis]REG79350.1 methyltransferase family protein [Marinomonas pollencensis]
MALQDDFIQLDRWLKKHQALWQFDSFAQLAIPWEGAYPELAQYLQRVDFTQLDNVDFYHAVYLMEPSLITPLDWQDNQRLNAPQKSIPSRRVPSYFSTGIKGRKWAQIDAFVRQTPLAKNYLEWCAGKGHLGKLLAYQSGHPVHSIEWQKTLCEAGVKESQRLQLEQKFSQVDVLKDAGVDALSNTDCVVALHACGDLHRRLLKQATAAKVGQLCLSPCCYHLTSDAVYQPLSQLATSSLLSLRKADLKLAVKEVATAGEREKRLRKLELTYRLGFDLWQREVRCKDEYLPLPSVQKSLLTQGFDRFCEWAADQKGLSEALTQTPIADFENGGEQRYQEVQKIEAISQLFRPALEYWLILDRALFLEEQGYQVEIGRFCNKELTPRNWFIRAQKDTPECI